MSFHHQYEPRSLQTHTNIALSHLLALIFETEPGHCFRNAWRCFVLAPDLFRSQGTFVEGWYVIERDNEVILTEHGWIERQGEIIDPSVILLVEPTTPVFYYPGVVRTWEETEALEGAMFPQVRFDGKYGADGLGHPAYQAAREAAIRKVYALALAQHPPKQMHFCISRDPEAMPCSPSASPEPPAWQSLRTSTLDLEQSRAIARQMQAQPGRCWQNARAAMLQFPRLFFFAHYVEGWLVEERADAILVIEHGWIESRSGSVIDPTLVLDELPRSLEYIAGDTLSWQHLQASSGASFPRARHTIQSSLTYQRACQQALALAEKLAWRTARPVRCCPGEIAILSSRGLTRTWWDVPVPTVPSERMRLFLALIRETIEC